MARVIRLWQGGDGQVRTGSPTRDDRFIPLIELIRGWDALGQPFLVPVRFCQGQDGCEQVRRSLYNAARYYCSCGQKYCTRNHHNVDGCPDGGQRISCKADLVRDSQGHLRVQFQFFDKKEAMREVVAKYGPDPSKWPYQAKAKKVRA